MPTFHAGQPDPVLLQTLQKMMGGVARPGASERRRARRYSYPTTQLIAPYDRGGLPTASQFREVRCQDLSTGGISFHWPTEPDFEDLVIQLGGRRSPVFVTAHITSMRPSGEPTGEFLIGCQFTGRVQVEA
jgi:hypothetical protein